MLKNPIYKKEKHKLSKTIRQAEKVGPNISLYSNTKKSENFLNKINVKITKRVHVFKGFASFYNIDIVLTLNYNLNILNLQLKVS